MPREGKTSITVNSDTFEMLKRNKPEGVTWDYHLQQLQYATDEDSDVVGTALSDAKSGEAVKVDISGRSGINNE